MLLYYYILQKMLSSWRRKYFTILVLIPSIFIKYKLIYKLNYKASAEAVNQKYIFFSLLYIVKTRHDKYRIYILSLVHILLQIHRERKIIHIYIYYSKFFLKKWSNCQQLRAYNYPGDNYGDLTAFKHCLGSNLYRNPTYFTSFLKHFQQQYMEYRNTTRESSK